MLRASDTRLIVKSRISEPLQERNISSIYYVLQLGILNLQFDEAFMHNIYQRCPHQEVWNEKLVKYPGLLSFSSSWLELGLKALICVDEGQLGLVVI